MPHEIAFLLVVLSVSCAAILLADALFSYVCSMLTNLTFRQIWRRGLWLLAVPVVLLLYGMLVEVNMFRVKNVDIGFEQLPEAFNGYRIVQLSDIHARSFAYRRHALARAVAKVNALQPDLIVFTGDLVTLSADELEKTAPLLSGLRSADGVISVLGNHDYGVYLHMHRAFQTKMADKKGYHAPERSAEKQRVIDAERAMGWDLLLNEHRLIVRGSDTLAVLGLEHTSAKLEKLADNRLQQAMAGTDGMFHILLNHDPTHWDAGMKEQDIPLTLSGHTHSGQFSLPGWSPIRYKYKKYRGLYEEAGRYLYINVGLGETLSPARVGAMPEITLVTLRARR